MPISDYTAEQLQIIGANIKRLREPRWKQKEFARLVGISPSSLSRIEAGLRPHHPSVYQRIANLLGTTREALAEDIQAGAA